jgi:hypothetical protein
MLGSDKSHGGGLSQDAGHEAHVGPHAGTLDADRSGLKIVVQTMCQSRYGQPQRQNDDKDETELHCLIRERP